MAAAAEAGHALALGKCSSPVSSLAAAGASSPAGAFPRLRAHQQPDGGPAGAAARWARRCGPQCCGFAVARGHAPLPRCQGRPGPPRTPDAPPKCAARQVLALQAEESAVCSSETFAEPLDSDPCSSYPPAKAQAHLDGLAAWRLAFEGPQPAAPIAQATPGIDVIGMLRCVLRVCGVFASVQLARQGLLAARFLRGGFSRVQPCTSRVQPIAPQPWHAHARRQHMSMEDVVAVTPGYLDHSQAPSPAEALTPGMRMIVVSWMVEVAEEFRLQQETLHLAVGLLDRFLCSTQDVPRCVLQLLAVACVLLAAKDLEVRQRQRQQHQQQPVAAPAHAAANRQQLLPVVLTFAFRACVQVVQPTVEQLCTVTANHFKV